MYQVVHKMGYSYRNGFYKSICTSKRKSSSETLKYVWILWSDKKIKINADILLTHITTITWGFQNPAPCDWWIWKKHPAAHCYALPWLEFSTDHHWVSLKAASVSTPDAILNSMDSRNTSLIDSLIHAEQKVAISQYVVQQYLQEIWQVRPI